MINLVDSHLPAFLLPKNNFPGASKLCVRGRQANQFWKSFSDKEDLPWPSRRGQPSKGVGAQKLGKQERWLKFKQSPSQRNPKTPTDSPMGCGSEPRSSLS